MATPTSTTIPAEPSGNIPRPLDLIKRVAKVDSEDSNLAPFYEDAIPETIERFEAAGSPVVTDGEQRKYHNFATYCVHGLPNGLRWFQNPVLRRTYAPLGAVHTLPSPLQAVRRLLPGCRHALRARVGQAGGDIAFGAGTRKTVDF